MGAPTIDREKLKAFQEKTAGDAAGFFASLLCVLGDRLGLFRALAEAPATSAELAQRSGVAERYAREWLAGLAAAGYFDHDPTTGRFSLPPERAAVLADEASLYFLGGAFQNFGGLLGVVPQLAEAFRSGGGVAQSEYPPDLYDGMARATAPWHDNLLVRRWVPAVPGLEERLVAGIDVADVGCGQGRALLRLAEAFPASRFTGFDAFAPVAEAAAARAEAAGVADRLAFRTLDAAAGLPGEYDLVTTFDVLHDAVDPPALLRSIRRALRPGGTYLVLEITCGDTVDDNAGPMGAMRYGMSVMYCMTTSLANGGAGLGTLGLPEAKLRALCAEAGFGELTRVAENPFNTLYAVQG